MGIEGKTFAKKNSLKIPESRKTGKTGTVRTRFTFSSSGSAAGPMRDTF